MANNNSKINRGTAFGSIGRCFRVFLKTSNRARKIIPAWLVFLPSVALAQSSWVSRFYQPSFRSFRYGSSGGYGGYGGYGSGGGLWGIMFIVMDILNMVVLLLVSFAVVFFLYGVLKYVTAGGDAEKMKEYKNMMIYGIISLFVMVSFWGIVNILRNTFQLDDYYVPNVPYFYDYGGGYYGGGIRNSNSNGDGNDYELPDLPMTGN